MNALDFLAYVLPDVPGCPEQLAQVELMQVFDDFCRKTGVWTEFLEPIVLVDDQAEYELDYPIGAKLLEVKSVKVNGLPLKPATMNSVDDRMPDWPVAFASRPTFYNSPNEYGVITVYPTPKNASSATMLVRAKFAPKLSLAPEVANSSAPSQSNVIPDAIAERYMYALSAGTKWRLMSRANKPWTDLRMAGVNKEVYDSEVEDARIKMLHERVEGTITVRPVRFG